MPRLEEFDDVQIIVEFEQDASRSNITSPENIADSLGKISKWYEALVPTGGSSGQFLAWNSSGTAKWVANPNVDTKVTSTLLAQSTAAATYLPTFVSAAGNSGVNIMNSFSFRHTPGTTSDVGNSRIVLGNATASGTANNEEGRMILYSSGTSYHTLKGDATASAVTHTLPTIGGTILNTGTTSFTQTLSSGTKIGSIKINSTSQDIYAPAVYNAALTLKGAGTTVTTFTANASSAKSLDIVAGSNVTITPDATNAKISIASSHPTITTSTDTTSTVSPAHGGTFTTVDSVTRDGNGHVTKINTKTVTLPADSNTDTLVSQTFATANHNRPLLMSYYDTGVTTTTAQIVHRNDALYFNPSSGGLYSFGFLWTDITGSTLDIDTLTLSDGTPHSRRFIEKTDGGATNIANIPVAGKPFLLEVDLIRWASTTDYITRQRFTNAANGAYSYVRYCTNGTWGSWTTRKYTDTNTKVTSSANHYAPATASGEDISDSATGATAAWGIDVVKGVTLNTDGKGHVTGISLTSGKIPANPVPSNNVTGSGTSGYLTKWNGTNTITNGPQLGSSTTTYLRNDGTWATPENTTYSAGTGLSLSGTTFNHSNSITAVTSAVFKKITYDAQGHITGTANVVASDIPSLDYSKVSISRNLTSGTKVGTITIDGTATDLYCQTNTNTTYTLTQDSTDGHKITLTPSSGTAQTITIPDNNTTYALSGAYGSSSNTWVTTLTPSSGTATTSTVPTASTSAYGITKLSSSTSSTSTTLAATSSAVKSAYDLANGKSTVSFSASLTSGTNVGTITIDGTGTDIYCETNTDTKVTDTVGTANTYYPAGGTSTSTATGTQVFDTSFKFIGTTGTTGGVGKAQLVLGNSTASGTANNKQGSIVIYGSTAYAHTIQGAPTAARTLTLPNKTGTVAVTSDIPTVNDGILTLKGEGTTVTTFSANSSSGASLDVVAGSNVTVTPDATNSKITIAAKDTVTTVTTSGSGNAVTAITASNGALTVTKGSTFSLSTHTHDNYMGAVKIGNYYGMAAPNGTDTSWTRTSRNGIIPYAANTDATDGNASSLGTSTYTFVNGYINNLYYKDLKTVTVVAGGTADNGIDKMAGSFFFSGNDLFGGVNDWVGIQAGYDNDKWQIAGNGGNGLMFRQNDSGGTNTTSWRDFKSLLIPDKITGSNGITVTNTTTTLGSGSTALTYDSGVSITHSNSVTAETTFNKSRLKYDAQGHITESSYYIHNAKGTGGVAGWVKIATIEILATYTNKAIMLTMAQRGSSPPYRLIIRFANANSTDPALSYFKLVSDETTSARAYMIKSATSTWDLYIFKIETYESITVIEFDSPYQVGDENISWTWQDVQTDASAITGGTEAGKIKNAPGIYPVKGTQTASTADWTGSIDVYELYDGLTIAYYLPYASAASVTLELTLADGTSTGAIPCYYTNETRIGTHYGAGSTVILTYWSAATSGLSTSRWTRCDYATTNANQTNTTTNADYRVLFSANANDTTQSGTTRKNINLKYNPSTATLKIGDYVSGSSATKNGKLIFGNSANVYTHTINTDALKTRSIAVSLNDADGIMGTDVLCYTGYESSTTDDTTMGSLGTISDLSNSVSFSGYLARFSYFTVLLCVGTDVSARSTVQVSSVNGYQSYQLIWGAAPSQSGGNLSITSGLVNISESSGTITMSFGKCASYWQFSAASSTYTRGTTPDIHVLKVYGHCIRSNGYH